MTPSARTKPCLPKLAAGLSIVIGFLVAHLLRAAPARAESFRVATYNIENYLDEPTETRPAKTAEAKAKVCDAILALKPDVLALQEMGNAKTFEEFRKSLASR